jgi:glycosyltransferase involved in cell wall biosynthesis
MKIGLIARSDRTGLGNQTRNLARLLNPSAIMLIDSTIFNNNKQHPELYHDYPVNTIEGFPSDIQVRQFLQGLDVVVTCEIFYNMRFVDIANEMGVKTINQYNWEFADYLRDQGLTRPTMLVAPSHWKLDISKRIWGEDRVTYMPTPVFTDDFKEAREVNFNRTGKKRFLHIMGRQAIHDRNGTMDLLNSLVHSREDFELVVRAQSLTDAGFFRQVGVLDPRFTVDRSDIDNEVDLYKDFDAMILPRRYAGQCLPMTEALCSGLPVIMTDISPNNEILPKEWLVPATLQGTFMARTQIDVFSANHWELAAKLDWLARIDLAELKEKAYNIGYGEYSNEVLKGKWERLIEDTCSR